MITYKHSVQVFLDNKKTGTIEQVEGGYRYFPLRSKNGGEIFKTIEEVKRSLEND